MRNNVVRKMNEKAKKRIRSTYNITISKGEGGHVVSADILNFMGVSVGKKTIQVFTGKGSKAKAKALVANITTKSMVRGARRKNILLQIEPAK